MKDFRFQNDIDYYKNLINDLIAENKKIKMEIEIKNSELKQISGKLKNTEKLAEKTILSLKNSIDNKNIQKHKHNKLFKFRKFLKNNNYNSISKTKNWLNSSLNDINNTLFSSLNTMENSNFY